jgi:ElaA protein
MASTESETLHFRAFNELSPAEIQAYYALRQRVFVFDQNSVYIDADAYDLVSFHGWVGSPPFACARVLPPGTQYRAASIGRIAVAPEARGHQWARRITRAALDEVYRRFGPTDVQILAQNYLLRFYADFGFEVISEPLMEDGIRHRQMLRPAEAFHGERLG